MPETASKSQVLLAQFVLVLMITLVAFGLVRFGVSTEVRGRIWQNLLERPSGPMTFRFVLQPFMATIAALYDGVSDARSARTSYLWAILSNPERRSGRLREGLISTARVILLGLCVDLAYQLVEFDSFYPTEAVLVALLLAFIPYVLLRGPCGRVARWWYGDMPAIGPTKARSR